jgi:hypothetical protein
MKKQINWVVVMVVAGATAFVTSAMAAKRGHGDGKPKPPIVTKPDTVEGVDAATFTIKVATGQKDRRTVPYTITAFTKIYINDKPSKLEDIQKGMRVSVASSDGKSATRIDAQDYTPPADPTKKDAQKPHAKNAPKK